MMNGPAPHFVMVADGATDDSNNAVIAGNERVLRARLADARFFWEQDRRQKLEDYLPQLEGVVFHARLGSMKEKAEAHRKAGALALFQIVPGADPNEAARAGILCKADLVTEMVGEFPDLQGVMGRYIRRPRRAVRFTKPSRSITHREGREILPGPRR